MIRSVVLLILLAVPFAVAEQDFRETHSEIYPIGSAKSLHIQWRVGEIRILKGADSNNIHVHYTIRSKRESDLQNAKIEFRTNGSAMTIEADSPFRGNTSMDAEIEVPDPMTLNVHLKVGDMTVEGIHGDKILEVSVGDIRVRMENEPEYRAVRAKTGIGNVSWTSDGRQMDRLHEGGWLGKKLSYDSNGKYELRAEVSVGDIQLQ
jgi:hypothetical protein